MPSEKRPDRVLPDCAVRDAPTHRPLERFWPYAELAEEPTDQELAALDPALREALFGLPSLPFSISLVFPVFSGERYGRAVALAKASDEYLETGRGEAFRHRARFFPGDRPLHLRDLYEQVADVPGSDVLVDDRPVPYARELWLPLVWMLIR
jgi:hypothetical protein